MGSLLVAGCVMAQDGIIPVTVEKVIADDRALEVRLDVRGGKVVAAIGRAPRFSRSPAEIDASSVTVADGKASGELKVNIASDGYAPTTNFTCKLDAPAKLQPRPAAGELARLTLSCENAINHDTKSKPQSRRLALQFAVRDGKAFAGKAVPPGSLTDVACAMRCTRLAVTGNDGKLAGEMEVTIQPQNVEAKPFVYVFGVDGRVIGDLATGKLTIERDGKDVEAVGNFVGTVRWGAPPEAGNALYKLTIHDALGTGKFVDLYLSAKGGRFTHGFGTSPNFNNATHEVDVSNLKLNGNKLTGDMPVTVLPDPWIPKDHKPVACAFVVDATIDGGEIAGTAGKFLLDGGLEPKPVAAVLTGGTVKLEAGLMGDAGYRSRAFVTFTAKDGKVTGGKVGNNHTKLAGTVDGGEIKIENEHLVGKIQATVTVGDGSTEGKYEFEVDTLMVGTAGAGGFTTHMGTQTKTGRLWAVVKLE